MSLVLRGVSSSQSLRRPHHALIVARFPGTIKVVVCLSPVGLAEACLKRDATALGLVAVKEQAAGIHIKRRRGNYVPSNYTYRFRRPRAQMRYSPDGTPVTNFSVAARQASARAQPSGRLQGARIGLPHRLEGVAQRQELGAHDLVSGPVFVRKTGNCLAQSG
jgi:hypothetical protein